MSSEKVLSTPAEKCGRREVMMGGGERREQECKVGLIKGENRRESKEGVNFNFPCISLSRANPSSTRTAGKETLKFQKQQST